MKKFSAQFLTLLLVLLSIGAFDLHALLDQPQGSHVRARSSAWPVASCAPVYSTSQATILEARSRKPRVGIVIQSGANDSKKGPAPLNTITTGGSQSSSFATGDPNGRLGMKVQLKLLERNQESNPLMVSTYILGRAGPQIVSRPS